MAKPTPKPLGQLMNSHPVRVNLGCGFDYRPDWINVDAAKGLNPDLYTNLESDSLLRHFKHSSVQLVLAQDILEHLLRPRAITVCREIFTILAPGCLLITRMPNARLVIDAPIPLERKINLLYGGQDLPQPNDPPEKSQLRKDHPELFAHKYGWDPDSFHVELSKIGFTDIVQVTEWPNFTTKAYKPKSSP